MALAIATVEHHRLAPPGQVGDRADVGLHEVRHVHVVADAGPVRGGVVSAMDHHRLASVQRHIAADADQISFTARPPPCPQARVCARHIEGAQRDEARAPDGLGLGQQGLGVELALAIGIQRHGRRLF